MTRVRLMFCLFFVGLISLGLSNNASAQKPKQFGDWAFTFFDQSPNTVAPVTLNVDGVVLQGSKISNPDQPLGANTIRGKLKGKRTVGAVITLPDGVEYVIAGEYFDVGLGSMVGVFERLEFFQPTGIYGIFFGSRVLQ